MVDDVLGGGTKPYVSASPRKIARFNLSAPLNFYTFPNGYVDLQSDGIPGECKCEGVESNTAQDTKGDSELHIDKV